jgi:hypothetical protein
VLSGKAERFATFDEALVKQARKLGVQPPVSAPTRLRIEARPDA